MKNDLLEKMIEYFGMDVKRINHALKVLEFAQIISDDESVDKETEEIIIYAAILHDIGIKVAERKYGSSMGKYQEIEGPAIAQKMLTDSNVPEDVINRVCFIIGNHHSYSKINGIDFQILVEADFLVNIFEDNISKEAIKNINNRIFKTESGKKLIRTMYLQ